MTFGESLSEDAPNWQHIRSETRPIPRDRSAIAKIAAPLTASARSVGDRIASTRAAFDALRHVGGDRSRSIGSDGIGPSPFVAVATGEECFPRSMTRPPSDDFRIAS